MRHYGTTMRKILLEITIDKNLANDFVWGEVLSYYPINLPIVSRRLDESSNNAKDKQTHVHSVYLHMVHRYTSKWHILVNRDTKIIYYPKIWILDKRSKIN